MSDQNELVITRYFNLPRELVWEAWSDPATFKMWWGPEGFTAPVAEIDFQVGGEFFGCMQGPDGKRYYSTGTYKEIVPLQKIVYTDNFADEKGNVVPASYYGMGGNWPEMLWVKVIFEELEPGKTKMTLTHYGMPEDQLEDCRAGWEESFDKLDLSLSGELEQGVEGYRKAA